MLKLRGGRSGCSIRIVGVEGLPLTQGVVLGVVGHGNGCTVVSECTGTVETDGELLMSTPHRGEKRSREDVELESTSRQLERVGGGSPAKFRFEVDRKSRQEVRNHKIINSLEGDGRA